VAIIKVRHRTKHLRAVQWAGANGPEIEALVASFEPLDECADDPEATAQFCADPHRVWQLVYVGDWIVERLGGGWERVRPDDFAERYEEASDAT
jgi:hypothetical protein